MDDEAKAIMQGLEKQWSTLTIANDFVFGKVMRDPELCREVLEAILRVPIERVEYVSRKESIEESADSKGIQLDVYVQDGRGTVYDVEMQATDTHELPRRARYYQSLMTLEQLEKGAPYRALKDSYVIFVCMFDLFGRGRRVYSFENRCADDAGLTLGDGTHTVFLSASASEDEGVGSRVNEFLNYVARGEVSGELSSRLDTAVSRVLDNKKWRLEYMLLEVRDQLNYDKGLDYGRQLGIEQGKQLGIEQGETRFARLAVALMAAGRSSDVAAASTDAELRRRLYEELGIE